MDCMSAIEELEHAVLHCGLPSSCRVMVAVSGGPDSVALLDTMTRLAHTSRAEWQVRAAHINHQLRGDESAGDELFVRDLCQKLGIEIDVVRVETLKHAKLTRISLETAARELRYNALHALLDAWGGDVIVTAHTADDQAETVLMRLLRGTGLSGLGGIRAQNNLIVRPFLSVRRETIIMALQTQGLGYRLDSSNLDTRHFRNRVRSRVIPMLQREAPLTISALARTALLLQDDSAYLEEETQIALRSLITSQDFESIDADARLWRALHPCLQRTTLRGLARTLLDQKVTLNAATLGAATARIEAARNGKGIEVELVGGVHLSANAHVISMRRGGTLRESGFEPLEAPIPGSVKTPAGILVIREVDDPSLEELHRYSTVAGSFHALCDASRLGSRLLARSRRPGDRFRPLGLGGSRKLQDILVDHLVPVELRDTLAIIENGQHPVWAPGLVLDQRVALDPETRRVLHMSFLPTAAVYHSVTAKNR